MKEPIRIKFLPDRVETLVEPDTFDRFKRVKFHTNVDFKNGILDEQITPEMFEIIGRRLVEQAINQLTENL